ncbi:TPA: hypothetical protein ACNIJL_000008 [Pseudomonas aeruginosa]
MIILFRPQGAFGWFSYITSRDTIPALSFCEALGCSAFLITKPRFYFYAVPKPGWVGQY